MSRTAFDDFFDEQISDPARAEAYVEARAEIDTVDKFQRAVEALRARRRLTKAKLATMSKLPAQSVRKVLTDKKANPGLATVLGMLKGMGYAFEIVPLKPRAAARPAARPAPRASSTKASAGRRVERQRQAV
jgi:DNA-binding phage protein